MQTYMHIATHLGLNGRALGDVLAGGRQPTAAFAGPFRTNLHGMWAGEYLS